MTGRLNSALHANSLTTSYAKDNMVQVKTNEQGSSDGTDSIFRIKPVSPEEFQALDPPITVISRLQAAPTTFQPHHLKEARSGQLTKLSAALSKENFWDFDAHFVGYTTGDPRMTRLRKKGGHLQMMHDANVSMPMTSIVAADIDNPEHQEHASEEVATNRMLKWDFTKAPLSTANYVYTTKGGYRLIWVMECPIPVWEAEKQIRYYLAALQEEPTLSNQVVDTLADWTRLFRLPYVMRDEQATWLNGGLYDPTPIVFNEHVNRWPLAFDPDPRNLPSDAGQGLADMSRFNTTDRPNVDVVQGILFSKRSKGQPTKSEFYKKAIRALKEANNWVRIKDHLPTKRFDEDVAILGQQGHRDNRILKFVGMVTSNLWHHSDIELEPNHIYALLHATVNLLNDEPESRESDGLPDSSENCDWLDILFDKSCRIYQQETSTQRASETYRAEGTGVTVAVPDGYGNETVQQRVDLVAERLQASFEDPRFTSDQPHIRLEAVLEHAVVLSPDGNWAYILKENGDYDHRAVNNRTAVSRIRQNGIDDWLPTQKVDLNGNRTYLHYQQLLDAFGLPAYEVVLDATVKQAHAYYDSGNLYLKLPPYSVRSNIRPCEHKDVGEWLRAFAGPDYNRLCVYLKTMLEFKRAAPILALVGPRGTGKTLFASIVQSMIDGDGAADGSDLLMGNGYHDSSMAYSPFILFDDGISGGSNKYLTQILRKWSSLQKHRVNIKKGAPVTVNDSKRIIISANSMNEIEQISSGNRQDVEDIAALVERLNYVHVSHAAQHWLLQNQGEHRTTEWMETGAAAEHFRWIAETTEWPDEAQTERFLSGSNAPASLIHAMRFGPLDEQVLIPLAELAEKKAGKNKVVIRGGHLYAAIDPIRSYTLEQKAGSLTVQEIASVLRKFSFADTELELPYGDTAGQWYRINIGSVIDFFDATGRPCPVLRSLDGIQQRNCLVDNELTGKEIREISDKDLEDCLILEDEDAKLYGSIAK